MKETLNFFVVLVMIILQLFILSLMLRMEECVERISSDKQQVKTFGLFGDQSPMSPLEEER